MKLVFMPSHSCRIAYTKFVAAVLLSACTGASASDTMLSIFDLKLHLSAYSKLESLSVDYRVVGIGGSVSTDMAVERHLRIKTPCYFMLDMGHTGKDFGVEHDYLRAIGVLNDTYEYGIHPFDRWFFRRKYSSTAALPGSLPQEIYLLASGVWPMHGRPPVEPLGKPYALHQVASSEFHDKVLPERELVDGASCHVLCGGSVDRLWLQVKDGVRLIRRELRDERTGYLMSRYRLTDHKELLPGVWCPMKIINEQYGTSDYSGRAPTVIGSLDVSRISIDVNPDCFDFSPEASWVEVDESSVQSPPRQVAPGGEDFLATLSKRALVHSAAHNSRSGNLFNAVVYWALAIVAVYIVAVVFYRIIVARDPGSA